MNLHRNQETRPAFSANFRHFLLMISVTCVFSGNLFAGDERESTNSSDDHGPAQQNFPDTSGTISTFTTNKFIDTKNPFFQDLGTNGRSCGTCHQASDAWTVTPAHLRERFERSDGRDPIFRLNDGANCSSADVSSVRARRSAYSLLLSKGLIRIAMSMPANAEFTVVSIDDSYHCSSASELSMYRRPLPTTNLRFLSVVMWDGRETVPGQPIVADLKTQAKDATLGHAQGAAAPTDQQLDEIVAFEMGLFTAQSRDVDAGRLDSDGGRGGPYILSNQEFFIGINDPLGLNPTAAAFDPEAFTIFKKWEFLGSFESRSQTAARESVARGEKIFNTKPISIAGVGGLNDNLHLPVITGTCTTCHDSPNVGDHSVVAPLNIGVSDASRRTNDLPLFTLHCNTTGVDVQTSDPGRAMVTGKCSDIGKVKGPILRGLAARPPYFHNGSAANLLDAVNFYDSRFALGLTPAEKQDLVAFLKSL